MTEKSCVKPIFKYIWFANAMQPANFQNNHHTSVSINCMHVVHTIFQRKSVHL